MNTCPGMNIAEPIQKFWRPSYEKKRTIVIATRTINYKNIFSNGLYQNILFLYKLFRCLGHHSILLTHEACTKENADLLLQEGYELLTPEQVLSLSFTFDIYIEVGMSIHVSFIHKLREQGTKIIKLYLGNTLNIDSEMIVDPNNLTFPHHTYSDVDEIWTSPHYKTNLDYLCGIFRKSLSCGKIAPYIWDSHFIDRFDKIQWTRPEGGWKHMNIVITEPNISYQKCALVPLLIANSFHEREPSWKGNIILMNSARLRMNVHLQSGLFSDLDIFKNKRVVFKEREDILTMLQSNPSAVFLSHQYNNEFNYMTLELMWKGWPILHNSKSWKNFGYYWEDTNIDETVELLKNVMKAHNGNEGKYAADARLLAWSYSMFNIEVQRKWEELLLST
jgi:hypothetical protein